MKKLLVIGIILFLAGCSRMAGGSDPATDFADEETDSVSDDTVYVNDKLGSVTFEMAAMYSKRILALPLSSMGLKADGTITIATLSPNLEYYGELTDVAKWDDIAAITGIYSECNAVGLRLNGTVVGHWYHDRSEYADVPSWEGIASVSVGRYHTVGLKTDGTVVAAGSNRYGQCDVSDWGDIVAVFAAERATIGVREDGKLVMVGILDYNERTDEYNRRMRSPEYVLVGYELYDSDWNDIIALSGGVNHTVGLKSDGTVVAAGKNNRGQCNVSDWCDIVAIYSADEVTIGLRSDGTIVLTNDMHYNYYYKMKYWEDIVALSVGCFHALGIKTDGSIVSVGERLSEEKMPERVAEWELFQEDR